MMKKLRVRLSNKSQVKKKQGKVPSRSRFYKSKVTPIVTDITPVDML